ncbi:hypothetical protein TNCV_2240841 [Trichonephila clavipes]|nr:hypothetical protein TNCV_2240841 [Trichonephila clavipes]
MSSLDCSARYVGYSASTHQSQFSLVIGSNTHGWLQMTPPTSCLKFKRFVSTLHISRRFTSVHDGPNRCPPRAHFNDRGARDVAQETRRIGICRSAGTNPCLHLLLGTQHETIFCLVLQRQLVPKKTLVDNFKRVIMEAKHVNEFRHDDVVCEKFSKGLLRNPDRPHKNTDKRMVYIYNNMLFVKKEFFFGFRTVKSGVIHLIQTTKVPMLLYEFPSSSLRCRAKPNLFRRSFEPFDQMLYQRMVLKPHTANPIPLHLVDGSKDCPGPSSKRKRVFITHVIRPPVSIARNSTCLANPQPVSIPEPPVLTTPLILLPDPPPELTTPLVRIPVFQPPLQISPVSTKPPVQLFLPDPPPVQILLPDPTPVIKTLDSTHIDENSIDQIMSSVSGDFSKLPPAHTQEPQLLETVPSLFDETNDLISFMDNLEKGLAIEQQQAPMDLTMPRMNKKIKKKLLGLK